MSALYTCISCRVAFASAEEQRSHFGTDWHRYNMKRRVAELPPLAASTFNERVLERREQNAIRIDPRSLECTTCRKSFSTENAFRSHVQSKKHRDREAVAAAHALRASTSEPQQEAAGDLQTLVSNDVEDEEGSDVDRTSEDEDDEADIEDRIASSRRRLRRTDCLFCPSRFEEIDSNLAHMSTAHSFFIPHREELSDLQGLLDYLGEKVAEGNLCLYCPNGGKEFGSIEAARRHMIDKAHCKIPFTTNEDRAELADFYWNDGSDGEEWEDESVDGGDDWPSHPAALSVDGLSLVLPSGRTLGHRALKVYYNQRLTGHPATSRSNRVDDKIISVRKRLADPSQALISTKGGHGAYGKGLEVMRAKNAGEATWAKKQARSHLDQKRREAFRTAVGFKHNNQKHFRDPLLQ